MKKVVFLALTALSLVSVSCGRDEDNENISINSIQGKWFIESNVLKFGNTSKLDDTILYSDECSKQSNWDFGSDKILVFTDYINNEGNCILSYNDANYDIQNNQIVYKMVENGETYTYTIKELTTKRLVLENRSDFDEDGKTDTNIIIFYK